MVVYVSGQRKIGDIFYFMLDTVDYSNLASLYVAVLPELGLSKLNSKAYFDYCSSSIPLPHAHSSNVQHFLGTQNAMINLGPEYAMRTPIPITTGNKVNAMLVIAKNKQKIGVFFFQLFSSQPFQVIHNGPMPPTFNVPCVSFINHRIKSLKSQS